MNSTRRPRIPWNKLLAVALLLLLLGYIAARPALERWWGIELPRLAESGNPPAATAKWELKAIDRGRLLSPAGLIYARGPQGEHRVDHVMRHAEDDPVRPQHGVFEGSREEILQLIDEAYQLIQQDSQRVNRRIDGDRVEYTIRFDRPIGYEGGRNGKRNRYPKVDRLRLVLEDGQSVITAYPVR